MSLKVWLPLDGDLRNLGNSDLTIIKNNNVTFTNGKIGQAAISTSSSNNTITVTLPGLSSMLALGHKYSLSCWVKLTGLPSSGYVIKLGSNSCGIWWSNSAPRWVWNENDNGKRIEGSPIADDYINWHHLAITVQKTSDGIITTKNYIDGFPSSYPTYSWDNKTNAQPTGDTITIYPYVAAFNDIRLYDHCLSPAEVKEIARGLVMHYKLDNIIQPNLLSGDVNTLSAWTKNQSTTILDDNAIKVTITNNTGDRRIYNAVSNVWQPANSTFTVSFDARAAADGLVIDVSRSNITSDMISFPLSTKWKHYSGTIINTAAATGGALSIRCLTQGGIFWVRNVKLERGNVETTFITNEQNNIVVDSSGYGYNGTNIGNITLNSNTARYRASAVFNGTNQYILAYRGGMLKDAITVNIWGYQETWSDSPGRLVSCTQAGGWNFENSGNVITFACGTGESANTYKNAKWSNHAWSSLSSGWHMFTGTYDGYTTKLYVDGKLVGSNAAYTTHTPLFYHASNGIFIGAEAASDQTTPTTPYFNGSISDFRIYCTALSAEDIKALYNTAARVDNGNRYHAFEYIEKNDGTVDGKNENLFITLDMEHQLEPKVISINEYRIYVYDPTTNSNITRRLNMNESIITSPELNFNKYYNYRIHVAPAYFQSENKTYQDYNGNNLTAGFYSYKIFLQFYNANDSIIKTITLFEDERLNQITAETIAPQDKNIIVYFNLLEETENFSYCKIQEKYVGTRNYSEITIYETSQAMPITPQIFKTGQFVNNYLDEQNYNSISAQIKRNGVLLADNFIEY